MAIEWKYMEQAQGELKIEKSEHVAELKPGQILIGGCLGWPTHWRASEHRGPISINYLVEYAGPPKPDEIGRSADEWQANLEFTFPCEGSGIIQCRVYGPSAPDAEEGKRLCLEIGRVLKRGLSDLDLP